MASKKKASKKKASKPVKPLTQMKDKDHCLCGQSLNYVDRQNGVCPSCGESIG